MEELWSVTRKDNELGKESLSQEFTVAELIQEAKKDESWEPDPQKRAVYADGFYRYMRTFL